MRPNPVEPRLKENTATPGLNSSPRRLTKPCRTGDYDVFVDDDGQAYHVRTGFVVERLDEDYLGGTGQFSTFSTPKPSEAPVMFKRQGRYYILAGTACCACKGGSSVYVLVAEQPLGPYTFLGDVGSNPGPFKPHSPDNYVTRAQASDVFIWPPTVAETSSNASVFVWLGNQWVTATEPGHPRNHDLVYWTPLNFTSNGSIARLHWHDQVTL